MKYIGVGLLSALAGAGIGVGQLFASLLIAYAKNPSLRDKLFSWAILGFAFVESLALFSLLICFLLLFS